LDYFFGKAFRTEDCNPPEKPYALRLVP
jgi:hypothetical protein